MKHTILSGIALAVIAVGPALAADMPVKAPIKSPPPVFSWTGCYIGGHGGEAWLRHDVVVNPSNSGAQQASPFTLSRSSWIAGGQVGCNIQAGSVVFGGEADLSSANLGTTVTAPNLFPSGLPVGSGGISVTSSVKWLASVRTRIGITVVPNVLAYVTGGPAWMHATYDGVDAFITGCPNCLHVSQGSTHIGLAVGGGVEWSPMSNGLLLRVEYLFYDLSGDTTIFAPSNTFLQGDPRISVVRGGISYKFN
jgi:outer membrane immunogenic protein